MAEALGLDQERARTLNYMGWARIDSGDAGGLADLERAVAIAVEANLPDTVTVYGNLANAVIGMGDLARGFELQTRALQAAERFGLASDVRTARWERVSQDYWQGDWDAVLGAAGELLAAAEAGAAHFMERACRQMRGLVRLARGDLPGALADAARAVELATRLQDVEAPPPALAFHARVLLASGQAGAAAARADELLAELAGRGAFPTNPDWSGDLAIVLRALGRSRELTALAAAAAIPTPWLAAATAVATGDFERAAARYAEIGSRPDEAHARLRAGERLLAAGRRTEGTAQIERALGFYRRVGAGAYLREAEELLAAGADGPRSRNGPGTEPA
jgi:tetratricopeptide (TPR) repeat protein